VPGEPFPSWSGSGLISTLVLRDCTHAVEVNSILFSKRQQFGRKVLPFCEKNSESKAEKTVNDIQKGRQGLRLVPGLQFRARRLHRFTLAGQNLLLTLLRC
jgi:hypothetical protein